MKPEIILVIVFGRIKFCEGRDLCHDGLIIRAALIQFLFVLFRLFLLPGIMIKNSASVLSSFVISLPVKGGWIVGFPKNFQEFIKADLFGIINDLLTFCMACSAGTDLFIRRIAYCSAGVTGSH